MNNYTKLINNLNDLKLHQMKNQLDQYIDSITDGTLNIVDAIFELTELEIKAQNNRAIQACVKTANFPYLKEVKDFDFAFQPGIQKAQIDDFTTLRFLTKNENIIFVGSSGVGKTHLATSIGIEAAKHRVSTYFITCHDLIAQLERAKLENRLEQRLKHFTKYKLLIIDELGYLPLSSDGAKMFFQLIAKRYEKRSTIITSNIQFIKWSEVFQDPVVANAILDRLLHHSHIVKITGNSYRMKDYQTLMKETDSKR